VKRLPAGLADPLHLSVPIPWKTIFVVGGWLLAIALLLWLIRLWLRRRREAAARRPAPVPPPLPQPGLADAIEALRRKHRKSGAFRAACHELSTLLRGYFERSSRRPYSTLTAGEIRRQVGDGTTSRFFGILAELQFRRRQPTGNDLDGVCDLALEVAQKERRN
jgi:hypothetical protein